MNARNANESGFGWTTGVKTATLIVVVGTLAAVWHPLRHSEVAEVVSTAATQAAANAAPDMSSTSPRVSPRRKSSNRRRRRSDVPGQRFRRLHPDLLRFIERERQC